MASVTVSMLEMVFVERRWASSLGGPHLGLERPPNGTVDARAKRGIREYTADIGKTFAIGSIAAGCFLGTIYALFTSAP